MQSSPASSIPNSLWRSTCSERGEGTRSLVPTTVRAEESGDTESLISDIMLQSILRFFYPMIDPQLRQAPG